MASQTFGNLEPNADWQQLGRTLIALAGGLLLLGIAIALLARFLPHIPLFEQMVLAPPDSLANAALALAGAPAMSLPQRDLSSQVGRSITMLRPAGKAQFGDNLVDVMTTGEFVEAGEPVEVVQINGNTVMVRAIRPIGGN
jgi:membrane-bound serine protease (ClpP class)